jgi:hypothetical protein
VEMVCEGMKGFCDDRNKTSFLQSNAQTDLKTETGHKTLHVSLTIYVMWLSQANLHQHLVHLVRHFSHSHADLRVLGSYLSQKHW